MRKLLVALILVVVLSLTFATPAFAGGPPENHPGLEAGSGPGWYGLCWAMVCIYQNWVPGVGMGMYTMFHLTEEGPPVKWARGHWK